MLIDLSITTVPYPAGSSTTISPRASVLPMAPAKVRHGAARLQVALASLPFPEANVRGDCA